MTTPKEDVRLLAQRGGDNEPLGFKRARHDGWRSVRLIVGGQDIGLATAAYSYKLTSEERVSVARRMTALWNLAAARGWSTDDIEDAANSDAKQGLDEQ